MRTSGLYRAVVIGFFPPKEILSITGLSIRETGVDGEGARFGILVPEGKSWFSE